MMGDLPLPRWAVCRIDMGGLPILIWPVCRRWRNDGLRGREAGEWRVWAAGQDRAGQYPGIPRVV
jgi:hypothetical protein